MSARRAWPWACARRCAATTSSRARTAGTAIAWPRARRSTACSPSCSARSRGPAFVECRTYRYYGHHVGDVNRDYRTREEEKEWMSTHDPLRTLAGRLKGLVDEGTFERIETDVKAEIDTGVQYALAAPYPDAKQVDEDVYA